MGLKNIEFSLILWIFGIVFFGALSQANAANVSFPFNGTDEVSIIMENFDGHPSIQSSSLSKPTQTIIISIGTILGAIFLVFFVFIIVNKIRSRARLPQEAVFMVDEKMEFPKTVFITGVQVKDVLGKGHFGEVRLGHWNGIPVALKSINEESDELKEEASILTKLKHPNIVQFFGSFFSPDCKQYMVFEYLANGSLLNFLHKRELTMHEIGNVLVDVCRGLVYLESQHVAHRDLALRNVLLDAKLTAKISDFGLAKFYEDFYKEPVNSPIPVRWASPEVLTQGECTSKSDVFSFAVLIWELFQKGQIPWEGLSNVEVLQNILDGERLSKPNNCPDHLYELMIKCWTENPRDRPTFVQVLKELLEIFGSHLVLKNPYDSSGSRNSKSNDTDSSNSSSNSSSDGSEELHDGISGVDSMSSD